MAERKILFCYISKADIGLYTYLSRITYRRSSFVKDILKDYFFDTKRLHLQPLQNLADVTEEKDTLHIPLSFQLREGSEEFYIYQQLMSCKARQRGIFIRNILTQTLFPYYNNFYQTEEANTVLPVYEKANINLNECPFIKGTSIPVYSDRSTFANELSANAKEERKEPTVITEEAVEEVEEVVATNKSQEEENVREESVTTFLDNDTSSEDDDGLLMLFGVDY